MASDFEARFGGIQRLYGSEGVRRLRAAHVAVVGVGGVGSWAVEALARSGVGKLTLVDADEVCVSNVNRQLPAVDGEIGAAKVEALAKRMRAINPELVIQARQEFFTTENAGGFFAEKFDWIVDAIDTLTHKAVLISECRRRGVRVITSGGAGGRMDSTAVRVADLAQASHDPLLQKLRKKLRAEYEFPVGLNVPFGIPAVFSPELPTRPQECEAGLRMDCNSGYGAVTFVTGVFGFAAAGWVVNAIASMESPG
jgi:tRNA A37 threonylcarbamoyladenosine dehydratase